MVLNIIQAGDKVDICLVKQMEEEKKTGIRAHVYKSQVTDIYKNGGLELCMPMEENEYILLPIGVRLELFFYSKSGLYCGTGIVEERYKSNNMHMMRVSLKSRLYKYQRRECHWMSCAAEMEYFDITAAQALGASSRQQQELADALRKRAGQKRGSVTAMSGAGLRFVTDAANKKDCYILIKIQDNLIPAYIFSSEALPDRQNLFENSAEFIIRDHRMQDDIVRYIFDEERKNRKKEVR